MTLTDKSKEDFYKWLFMFQESIFKGRFLGDEQDVLDEFDILPKICKYALITEWFDSVGVWSNVINDVLILDRDYFKKCSWQSNIELLIITARDIYNETFK